MRHGFQHPALWQHLSRGMATLLVAALASAAHAATPTALEQISQFDIKSQPLSQALIQFSAQAGVQVVTRSEDIARSTAQAVHGTMPASSALRALLAGTGLTYQELNDKTIAIGSPGMSLPAAPESIPSKDKEGKTGSSDSFRLAQATPGANPATAAVSNASTNTGASGYSTQLSDIVVTAQKREERLQDVPVPVTAIPATSLIDSNEVRIQDYALTVPGLSVSGQNGFYENLSIRGITTGTANPTVGIMIDDVPFGSTSIDGGGLFVPDFDPGDLARVEVLRGPQGTLYGASSMGGLLKFVTIEPSTSGLSARVSAGTSSIYNGSALGYNVRASVNVPLSDSWAVRLSGFAREDPGFIDDPFLHRDAVNKTTAEGGRIAALWRPSDLFSMTLTALYQDVRLGGDNNVEVGPGLSTYDQVEVPGGGSSDMKIQVYTATEKAKFGAAELTAISGYTVNSSLFSQDYSALFDSAAQFGVADTRLDLDMRNAKFTQEIRLVMPLGSIADGLLGVFYSHERTSYGQALNAVSATTGQFGGQWVYFSTPQTYSEYSGFADVTFHINDRFDLQIGARDSQIKQNSSESQTGAAYAQLIGSGNPVIYPPIDASVNAFTYLLTPRYKLSDDWMTYARLASGYRPGGPNVAPGVPPQYQPDKTQNYELGVKGNTLEHRLNLDASLYYIDWKNIQLTLLDPANYQGYTANASRAKSQGLEISLTATPGAGLTTSAWVAWNTATLKQGFPYSGMLYEAYGAQGNRLPFSSRFSGNISVTEEIPLSSQLTASFGLIESYVGNQIGGFQNTVAAGVVPPRQYYPSYARMDLRAGIKYDSWSVNLFGNNITNRFAVTPLGGLDASPLPSNYFTVLQPRLVGINVTRNF